MTVLYYMLGWLFFLAGLFQAGGSVTGASADGPLGVGGALGVVIGVLITLIGAVFLVGSGIMDLLATKPAEE